MLGAFPATRLLAVEADAYQNLRYRLIGPFRAGRTVGAVGLPDQPNVFFVGVNNGGVWKTDDSGRTWSPIFDAAPTGSIGDLAVCESAPNVLYVGTGEGLHRPDLSVGDGIYKSTDGGATWSHVGLPDVQQVARLIVDPRNPDTVLVAGLGHPYGANEERGVFRTLDGARTWQKVLYVDQNTGAAQVEMDNNDPRTVYAVLWEHREGPWENAAFSGRNSGLFKSTDGGDSWRRLGAGLPTADQGLGRIGIGLSPSDSLRIYATVDARDAGGIYRSDDGGENWVMVSDDHRLWGRGGDFAEIRVHPKDPNVVFVGNVASYRSDDGGRSWVSIKGAPGGDDYHRIWINPRDPAIMLFAADQGATITVNAGRTWSSWYNQPTAQLYHVSTDNQFPYWVYGGQQESGAIAVASRGPGGQISFRDSMGVGADEYAYVAPDPLHPHLVYGGRVLRFDKRTGQTQNVAPEALRSGLYRTLRSMPLMFHPADPELLLFATNVLWATRDGGENWRVVSPDLSREQPGVPPSIGDFATPELATMARRGVIYSLGPSPLDKKMIWAGTDDGLVHLTRDGGATWRDVTPPTLRPWDKVSSIDAGHFDQETAYIAVNAIRRDDSSPLVFRTRDGGRTWRRISAGLGEPINQPTSQTGSQPIGQPISQPISQPINVVREDPKQVGLLFAGSERQVFFSSDAGERWHSLRQNMPASSVRDLVVHDDDLVVGTHGRSIWILDDISPLRQLAVLDHERPFLFAPAPAVRVRWNHFSDTPLPPEEPAGENPPDGASLDYFLPQVAQGVALEILDGKGELIRRYSNDDPAEVVDPDLLPHPTYWIRPAHRVSTSPGHHRFVWDLRYPPPRGAARQFSIAAVREQTPTSPQGPWVSPGTYRVRLRVDGVEFEQPITVGLDPRLTAGDEAIRRQTELSMRIYRGFELLQSWREAVEQAVSKETSQSRRSALSALRGEGLPENPDLLYGSITARPAAEETLVGLQEKFLYLLVVAQSADVAPTASAVAAAEQLESLSVALRERARRLLP